MIHFLMTKTTNGRDIITWLKKLPRDNDGYIEILGDHLVYVPAKAKAAPVVAVRTVEPNRAA